MRRLATVSFSLLVLLLPAVRGQAQPAPAQAPLEGAGFPAPQLEPRPPSGIGAIVVGYAALGSAVMNLATLPLCTLDFYEQHDATALCYGTSAAIAAVALAVAVPSLVVGHARRRRYREWRGRQKALALLSKLRVAPAQDSISLGFRQRW